MKVLVIANSRPGLYNFRKELLKTMLDKGYEVAVSAPCGNKSELLSQLGCRLIDTPVDRRGINPIKDIKLLVRYFFLLKKEKPDVVLTYTVKPNLYGGLCCKILKIPYISNITGLGSGFRRKFIKVFLHLLYKAALSKKANIFAQNEENLNLLKAMKLNPKSLELIPGSGVNLEQYEYIEYPENDIIEFFFVARVMKEKGIEEYLKAAKYCKEKGYNTKFHIFGSCEEAYGDILNELDSKGVITYHGVCNDMKQQYKYSSCTVHPSYHEGMSNVLLETGATGRPCICSNISGCKESVEDGVTGILVEPKNPESLIQAIEKFIALDAGTRREMGVKARQKVEKEFDRNIVVNKYMNKITEITKGE